MNRLAIFAVLTAVPLLASRIDVSNQTFAKVHPGAQLVINFGVANYGANNHGYSPYPTGINLEVMLQEPGVDAVLSPYSSASYYSGYLFDGWIESLDGSVMVPLSDALAMSLGYGTGKVAMGTGVVNSGSVSNLDVGILYASALLTEELSRQLFGTSMQARIVLRNVGENVYVGIGDGYTVRNSVMLPGISGDGPAAVGGVTQKVTVYNPEPSTWMLGGGALALLLFKTLRAPAARARKRERSRV